MIESQIPIARKINPAKAKKHMITKGNTGMFISLLVWVKKPPEAAEQRGVFTPSKLHEES